MTWGSRAAYGALGAAALGWLVFAVALAVRFPEDDWSRGTLQTALGVCAAVSALLALATIGLSLRPFDRRAAALAAVAFLVAAPLAVVASTYSA